jgi:hypothetical protein
MDRQKQQSFSTFRVYAVKAGLYVKRPIRFEKFEVKIKVYALLGSLDTIRNFLGIAFHASGSQAILNLSEIREIILEVNKMKWNFQQIPLIDL